MTFNIISFISFMVTYFLIKKLFFKSNGSEKKKKHSK
mgnify:FL=1